MNFSSSAMFEFRLEQTGRYQLSTFERRVLADPANVESAGEKAIFPTTLQGAPLRRLERMTERLGALDPSDWNLRRVKESEDGWLARIRIGRKVFFVQEFGRTGVDLLLDTLLELAPVSRAELFLPTFSAARTTAGAGSSTPSAARSSSRRSASIRPRPG